MEGLHLNSGQVSRGSFVLEAGEITNYEVEFDSRRYNIGFNKSIENWSFSVIQGIGERTISSIEAVYGL